MREKRTVSEDILIVIHIEVHFMLQIQLPEKI